MPKETLTICTLSNKNAKLESFQKTYQMEVSHRIAHEPSCPQAVDRAEKAVGRTQKGRKKKKGSSTALCVARSPCVQPNLGGQSVPSATRKLIGSTSCWTANGGKHKNGNCRSGSRKRKRKAQICFEPGLSQRSLQRLLHFQWNMGV